jgi:cytochrome c556
MRKLMMIVCTFASLAIYATVAISAEELAAAVKERRDLMKKTVAPAAKLGGQMVKGVEPFDAEKAAKAMNEISGVPDKYVTLFPKGTEHGGVADSQIPNKDDRSEAKPEIWEKFDD